MSELPAAKNDGGTAVPTGDERALEEAVARQPVMAAIDVTEKFTMYKGGVFQDPLCSASHLNHVILVAGYGTDSDGVDYWIVQNSWGECLCNGRVRRVINVFLRLRYGMGDARIHLHRTQ